MYIAARWMVSIQKIQILASVSHIKVTWQSHKASFVTVWNWLLVNNSIVIRFCSYIFVFLYYDNKSKKLVCNSPNKLHSSKPSDHLSLTFEDWHLFCSRGRYIPKLGSGASYGFDTSGIFSVPFVRILSDWFFRILSVPLFTFFLTDSFVFFGHVLCHWIGTVLCPNAH